MVRKVHVKYISHKIAFIHTVFWPLTVVVCPRTKIGAPFLDSEFNHANIFLFRLEWAYLLSSTGPHEDKGTNQHWLRHWVDTFRQHLCNVMFTLPTFYRTWFHTHRLIPILEVLGPSCETLWLDTQRNAINRNNFLSNYMECVRRVSLKIRIYIGKNRAEPLI